MVLNGRENRESSKYPGGGERLFRLFRRDALILRKEARKISIPQFAIGREPAWFMSLHAMRDQESIDRR